MQNTPQPHELLTLKAAALARIAPDQWRDFLAALADFTEVHRENLVKSPLEHLPVNQGRAQILSLITEMFGKAVTSAEKMKQKGN